MVVIIEKYHEFGCDPSGTSVENNPILTCKQSEKLEEKSISPYENTSWWDVSIINEKLILYFCKAII